MSMPKPLLRRSKYYVKAANGECANCKRSKHGCCMPYLHMVKDDFQMDFTSIEDIRALLATRLFAFSIDLRPYRDDYSFHANVIIRGRKVGRETVCVFWTNKGCRLTHNARPKVCRTHQCYRMEKGAIKVNRKDEKRTASYRKRKFTLAEVKTLMLSVMDYDNKEFLHGNEYNRLDWDSILTVLQGRP